MDERALEIVRTYIEKHLDKSDEKPTFNVYTVWKSKVLQNWKYLISSTLYDGMYYEITFNGDKSEWYLDAYKKFENVVIPEPQMDKCESCKSYNGKGCDLHPYLDCQYEPKESE